MTDVELAIFKEGKSGEYPVNIMIAGSCFKVNLGFDGEQNLITVVGCEIHRPSSSDDSCKHAALVVLPALLRLCDVRCGIYVSSLGSHVLPVFASLNPNDIGMLFYPLRVMWNEAIGEYLCRASHKEKRERKRLKALQYSSNAMAERLRDLRDDMPANHALAFGLRGLRDSLVRS